MDVDKIENEASLKWEMDTEDVMGIDITRADKSTDSNSEEWETESDTALIHEVVSSGVVDKYNPPVFYGDISSDNSDKMETEKEEENTILIDESMWISE